MANYRDKIAALRIQYRQDHIDWRETALTMVYYGGQAVTYLAAGALIVLVTTMFIVGMIGWTI